MPRNESRRKTNPGFGGETKSIRVYNSSRNWRWKSWGTLLGPVILELGRIVVPSGCRGILSRLRCNISGVGEDGDGNLIPFGCSVANGLDYWYGLFGGLGEPHFGLRICNPTPTPDRTLYVGDDFPGMPVAELEDWNDNRAESCFSEFHNRRIVVIDEDTMIRFFVGLPRLGERPPIEQLVPVIRASMDCAIGPIGLFEGALAERVGL